MSPGGVILLLVLLAICAGIVYRDIYDSTDHSRCEHPENLKENAVITETSREEVGTKGNKHYRTTFFFDDGFIFISHRTTRIPHLTYYQIYVSREDFDEMISSAHIAHARFLERYRKRHRKS